MPTDTDVKTPTNAPRGTRWIGIARPGALVGVGVARASRGCDAETILRDVECGRLLWVFDFSFGTHRRCMRFLAQELAEPEAWRHSILAEAIDVIVPPTRVWFAPGEVLRRLLISKQTLLRLRRSYGLPLGNLYRDPLVQFLKQRWVGGQQNATLAAGATPATGRPVSGEKAIPCRFRPGASSRACAPMCRPPVQKTKLKPLKGLCGHSSGVVPKAKTTSGKALETPTSPNP